MSLFELLDRERRYLARLLGASGVTLLVGTVAILLAAGTLLLGGARWLAMPRIAPFILWLGVVAVAVWAARWAMAFRQRLVTLPGVATEVEKERALRDGSIRGTMEVAESGPLGRLGAESMAKRLAGFGNGPLAPGLRRRMGRWLGIGLTGALGSLAVLVAGTALAPDGWAALLHPIRAWNGTLLEGVQLERVPGAVMRGERVTVTVRAPGRNRVTVAHRRTGATWRTVEVDVVDGTADVRLDPLDADLSIYATDGRAVSDTVAVSMVERPFIGDVTIRAQFPAYLARQPEALEPGELIRVPQGTQLTVEGTASTSLASVALTRGSSAINLDVDGLRFSGRVPTVTGTYQWEANGASGPIPDVPLPLEIDVLPDSAPRVEILSPGGDTTFALGDTVAISFMATDDHGVARVAMRSWIVKAGGTRQALPDRVFPASNEGELTGSATVSPRLDAGDALHLVIAATDGSPWRLTGESRELVLRLPTRTDQRVAARNAADSAVARAEAAVEAQRQLQERTQQASRERSKDMTFESAERAKSLAREQRDLAGRVEELQQAAQDLERQLAEAGALDSALQKQLEEAQRLMRDALTPELAEQLRKLEEASQQLSQEGARQAMTDLAQQQQRIRDMLEKSVEMLKRAALEGSMSTLSDEAKDLAQRQREIADSLAKARDQESRSEVQQKAQQLADQTRELSDEVRELQRRLQQNQAQTGAERVGEAEQRMRESADALERAAQNRQVADSATRQAADSAMRANAPQQAGQQQQQRQGEQQGRQGQQGQQQQGQQQQGRQGQQGQQQQGQQQQGRQGQQGQQQQGQQQQGRQGQQGQQQQGQQGQQGQQQQGQQGQQQQGQQGQQGGQQQSVEEAARQAAQAMDQAAKELQNAREQQVGEWKAELTTELDRSIQEMIQLAREQESLEAQARRGASPEQLRAQQSSLQQGVEQSADRLAEAAQRSSLLSQRSLRTVNDARKRVEDATQRTRASSNSSQVATAMKDASEALNQAAASLVRDRERAEVSNSATGFEEMLKQLQQMAQMQSGLNDAAQSLLPRMGTQLDAQGQQQARQLARQQRDVAAQLDDVGDRDDSGRADELAREARQIAALLESAQVDPATLERQQRLFRKMLDAGRLLEEEEREDTGKREAKSWTGTEVFTPQGSDASGRSANRFQAPTWNDLRGLTPDERRLVLEYFRKINGQRP